jgi:urease accessory protein
VLGSNGLVIRAVEVGVLGSAIVLGAIVLVRLRASLPTACICAGLAAVFHGHVHGAEIPVAANAMNYVAGLITATAVLHASGIAVMCRALSAGPLVITPASMPANSPNSTRAPAWRRIS